MLHRKPTVQEVSRELKEKLKEWRRLICAGVVVPGDKDAEVRLQVYLNGDWTLWWGDPQWDADLPGYWGASTLAAGLYSATSEEITYATREVSRAILGR